MTDTDNSTDTALYDAFIEWLSRTRVIVTFFLAMLLSGALIYPLNQFLDGNMLDLLSSQQSALEALAKLSDQQRSIHIFGTLIADTIYPLAYGGFLAGVAAKLSGSYSRLAVWPAFLTVAADFAENAMHVISLMGQPTVLIAKDVLTPTKFVLFQISAVLVIFLCIASLVKWVQRRKTPTAT